MLEDIFDGLQVMGRKRRDVSATAVRGLTSEDLVTLMDGEKGSQAPALKRISERHHALARLLAGGTPPGEAALIAGYDNSRVSILQNDPAFNELVEFYREDITRELRGLHERMYGLALDAADVLQDRLEDEPEKVSVGQLLEVLKIGADRTGFGPSSQTTNVNVNVDLANRLEAARKRVKARQYGTVIEGDVE